MKNTEDSDCFPEVEYWHDNPVASFDYAHVCKSSIYFSTQLIGSRILEKPVNFFITNRGVTVASAITLYI